MRERAALVALQFRASTAVEAYREAILAHPDAIDLPFDRLREGRVRVAEVGNAPVGFSVLLAPADGIAELDGLFVDPPYWLRGIGKALLHDAVRRARAEGAVALEVTANPTALEFYLKFGFEDLREEATRFGPARRMSFSLAKRPPRRP